MGSSEDKEAYQLALDVDYYEYEKLKIKDYVIILGRNVTIVLMKWSPKGPAVVLRSPIRLPPLVDNDVTCGPC